MKTLRSRGRHGVSQRNRTSLKRNGSPDEIGNKFQGIAVVRANRSGRVSWHASENDGGFDAHASGELEPDGKGLGLACSTAATIKKVELDAAKTKVHYPDVRVLIFATGVSASEHTKGIWAKQIAEKFDLVLQVVSREEFIVWLLDPANSDICRDQLGIAPSMTPTVALNAREAVAK